MANNAVLTSKSGHPHLLDEHVEALIANKRVLAVLEEDDKNNDVAVNSHVRAEFDALKHKLFELKAFLEGNRSPEGPELEPGTTLEDGTHPFPGLPLYHKCVQPVEMTWRKPSSIDVVGSFLLHTMAKPVLNVDLSVEIPDECLEERDIKNYAYFDKKQLYLRAIAAQLLQFPDIKNGDCYMDVAAIHHDKVKTCIRLQYKHHAAKSKDSREEDSNEDEDKNHYYGEAMNDFAIRIYVRASERAFNRSQLSPQWNNVQRRSHRTEPQPATPCYNSIIASDMFMKQYLYTFHSALLEVPNAVDSIILLKLWVISKGMLRQPDSINGFLVTAIVVLLIRKGVVLPEMTVVQIVRAALQFLAENNLSEQPHSLFRVCHSLQSSDSTHEGSQINGNVSSKDDEKDIEDDDSEDDTDSDESASESSEEQSNEERSSKNQSSKAHATKRQMADDEPVPLTEFCKNFDCVLVDPTGFANLSARMTKDGAGELQRNAVLALTAVGFSGAATKHLKALFSQHEEEESRGKVDAHSGPAAASFNTVKHSDPAESLERVFLTDVDPVQSFDRVLTSSFPQCPVDDRAAPPESILKLTKKQSSSEGLKRKGLEKNRFSELASSAVQQREEELTGAYSPLYANALSDERWEYGAKRKMLNVLQRGLSNRVSQLRLYFCFENPYSEALRDLIDRSDKDFISIHKSPSVFQLSQKHCDFPWCSPLELRWPVFAVPPQVQAMWMGVNLHPVHSKRLVDRGPDAEDKKGIKEFSSFWGSKAELRRFADGSIVQAVVWNAASKRQEIVAHIVSHLLRTHFNISGEGENISASIPSVAVEAPLYFTQEYACRVGLLTEKAGLQWFQSAESASSKAMSTVDSLTRALRMAEGVPLRLVDVFAVSSSLRQTTLYPPCPHPAAFGSDVYENAGAQLKSSNNASLCPNVHDLLLRFENTSKWPEDLEALRAAKHGFYLQIKKDLEKMLGAHIRCTATQEFVEVFYEGLVFRLRMFVPHELRLLIQGSLKPVSSVIGSTYLLGGYGVAFADPMEQTPGYVNVGTSCGGTAGKNKKRRLLENGRVQVGNRSANQCQKEACSMYKHFVLKPRHFSAVSAFASYYPAYAETVRLASAWLESHMLLHEHFSVEAVELLVASTFCDPRPNLPPQSATVGLLRFLRLLWSFDWHGIPLLVDIESLASSADNSSLWQRFLQVRGKSKNSIRALGEGGPPMYLVTPYERGLWRPQWTADSPSRAVLYRTQRLARDAEQVLSSYLWCIHMSNSTAYSRPLSTDMRKGDCLQQMRRHFTSPSIPFLSDFSSCISIRGFSRDDELPGGFNEFWKVIFAPYINDYDIVVRLNNASLPRRDGFQCGPALEDILPASCLGSGFFLRSGNLFLSTSNHHEGALQESELQVVLYKNMVEASRMKMMSGFDPVANLIEELEKSYGRSIMVFRSVQHGIIQGNCSLYISLKQNQFGDDIQETLTNVAKVENVDDRRTETVSHLMSVIAGIWEKGVGLVKNVQLLD